MRTHSQWISQLQLQAGIVIQGFSNVKLEGIDAAGCTQLTACFHGQEMARVALSVAGKYNALHALAALAALAVRAARAVRTPGRPAPFRARWRRLRSATLA